MLRGDTACEFSSQKVAKKNKETIRSLLSTFNSMTFPSPKSQLKRFISFQFRKLQVLRLLSPRCHLKHGFVPAKCLNNSFCAATFYATLIFASIKTQNHVRSLIITKLFSVALFIGRERCSGAHYT